jgi:hypothetical protein
MSRKELKPLKFLKQLPNLAQNPEKTRKKVAGITKIPKTAQKYSLLFIFTWGCGHTQRAQLQTCLLFQQQLIIYPVCSIHQTEHQSLEWHNLVFANYIYILQ